MTSKFEGKTVLVTGACGTIGQGLVKALLTDPAFKADRVIGIDNQETALFFLDQTYIDTPEASFYVADLRDRDELLRRFAGVDVVFHAAALKHVVMCERSPDQAVQCNILGLQNVIAAAHDRGIQRVIFTSSDKAVNPTNVMGTSKLMGERLITAANRNNGSGGPTFAATRFGNVLGSSGSVVPIFHQQIAEGGPVTVTDPDMTRFVMGMSDAIQLVLDSAELAHGGEVFITKMPVVRIQDLAEVMVDLLAPEYGHDPEAVEIKTVGIKPGEKLYEELMTEEETRRSVELPNYFSVLPAFRGLYSNISYDYPELVAERVDKTYRSSVEPPASKAFIREFLVKHGLLDTFGRGPTKRYWPGDKEAAGTPGPAGST